MAADMFDYPTSMARHKRPSDAALDEPVAVLDGAVTGVSSWSFGAEADRLREAWDELERPFRSRPARRPSVAGNWPLSR